MLGRVGLGVNFDDDEELEFVALNNNDCYGSVVIESFDGKVYNMTNGQEIVITRSGYSLNPLQLYNPTGSMTIYNNNEVVTWG